jgi:hypothetical protein
MDAHSITRLAMPSIGKISLNCDSLVNLSLFLTQTHTNRAANDERQSELLDMK